MMMMVMMMMIVSLREDKTSPKLPVRKDSALGLKRRKSRTVRGKRLSRVNHHQRCPSCLYPGCHLLGHTMVEVYIGNVAQKGSLFVLCVRATSYFEASTKS